MVDILTLVSLHHGHRVAPVLLIEPASSGAAVSAHAVVGVVVVSTVLFSFDARQSQERTLCCQLHCNLKGVFLPACMSLEVHVGLVNALQLSA